MNFEKIPRQGDPGISKRDFFVIRETERAPSVGADSHIRHPAYFHFPCASLN